MVNTIQNGLFETVVGLEVHAELKTDTKIFCSCKTDFGGEPNTRCCPVCMGLPGALPVLNKRVVDLAILAGLALNCEISEFCIHDRKNYFYPDLPKAYQISQLYTPLCRNGYLDVTVGDRVKRIRIERIHIEEDAGKLIHTEDKGTLLDCNRCGIPLIEIVTMPDISSAEEARAYLEELRSILLFAGISDCRMNEGSLRCDINLSVRRVGESPLGQRTEIKNLNSFAFAAKAIDAESKRQIEAIYRGESIIRETRRYDEHSGKTLSMRTKESAADYRYFTDPDLPPFTVTNERIDELKAALPRLPRERMGEYREKYGIPEADCKQIVSEPACAELFESGAALTSYPKILANLLIGEIFAMTSAADFHCPISAKSLAALSDLQGDGRINSSTTKTLLKELWECDRDPVSLVCEKGLMQICDPAVILEEVRRAIRENPRAAEDYRLGKKAAAKSIVGRVMASTRGRAEPMLTSRLVEEELNK